MTVLSVLFLGFGLSHASDLGDDLQWGVGIEDYVTIDLYSDPDDVGLVCVAIEDWSVPADSELSCFDEDGLEFFGAVDLAMLEWVGSASATHAYWHALSPDTVEIVLLAAAAEDQNYCADGACVQDTSFGKKGIEPDVLEGAVSDGNGPVTVRACEASCPWHAMV